MAAARTALQFQRPPAQLLQVQEASKTTGTPGTKRQQTFAPKGRAAKKAARRQSPPPVPAHLYEDECSNCGKGLTEDEALYNVHLGDECYCEQCIDEDSELSGHKWEPAADFRRYQRCCRW